MDGGDDTLPRLASVSVGSIVCSLNPTMVLMDPQALADKLSGAPAMSAVLRGSLLSALTRLQQQAPQCLAEAASAWLPAVAAAAADGPHARAPCVHTATHRGATCADCRQQLQVRRTHSKHAAFSHRKTLSGGCCRCWGRVA